MADQLDPQISFVDRLYLFWQAYDEEAKLLEKWHDDPVRDLKVMNMGGGSRNPNPLYVSFLNTWGEGEFESDSPLEQKSYFAVLGVVSRWLKNECLTVLNDVLDRDKDGDFKLDPETGKPQLRAGISQQSAEDKAKKKIMDELLQIFVRERDLLANKIDPVVEKEAGVASPPRNDSPYFKALARMMHIETECFTTQRNFLEKGTITNGAIA
jgi:hypothetical protein